MVSVTRTIRVTANAVVEYMITVAGVYDCSGNKVWFVNNKQPVFTRTVNEHNGSAINIKPSHNPRKRLLVMLKFSCKASQYLIQVISTFLLC